MKCNTREGVTKPSHAPLGKLVRTSIALLVTITSIALAWILLNVSDAHAAGVVETPTQTNPWGVAFDNKGHIWVAEPGCDASPMCAMAFPSYLGEYNISNDTLVGNVLEPAGYSSPVNVAVSSTGDIWFTEPTSNAIGKFVPGSATWSQWNVPTANAIPYDLAFDSTGNLWFTEYGANHIGFFNVTTHTFVENVIPTAASHPYGITKALKGTIWFAENAAPKIASFKPTKSGKVTISEHVFSTLPQPPTAHLITTDVAGHIWFSEGFSGMIGEFLPGTNAFKTFNVSLGLCPTPTPSPTPTSSPTPTTCPSTHISGISVSSTGNVWFDDSLSARVGYLKPSTGKVTTLTLSSSSAHPHDGLSVDSQGNTWFTEVFGLNLGMIAAGTI